MINIKKMKCVLLLCAGVFFLNTVSGQHIEQSTFKETIPAFEPGFIYFKFKDYSSTKLPSYFVESDEAKKNEIESILEIKLGDYEIIQIEKSFKLMDSKSASLSKIYSIKFLQYDKADELVGKLQLLENVEYAERVVIHTLDFTPNDPDYSSLSKRWHLDNIKAEAAWDIKRGSSGIVVAVIDQAVEIDHEDLTDAIWHNSGEMGIVNGVDLSTNGIDDDCNGYIDDYQGWDFAHNINDPSPTGACYALGIGERTHGTLVAGCVAATSDNNIGIASLGHGLKIMPLKVETNGGTPAQPPLVTPPSTCKGNIWPSSINNAIEYAIFMNANIINLSLGGSTYSRTQELIINYAVSQNITVVAAAGNDGATAKEYPAAYQNVIAVGASDDANDRASFSNYGNWVDVLAPGEDIWSTSTSSANLNDYGFFSGNSFSSPIVAGLCGLMLSINPNLTPQEIRNCLESTAHKNSSLGIKSTSGIIDAEATLECISELNFEVSSNFQSVCPGQEVKFAVNQTSGAPITTWTWTFNGASITSSTQEFPSVLYNTLGSYNVSLTASNGIQSKTVSLASYITVLNSSVNSGLSGKEDDNWYFGNHLYMDGQTHNISRHEKALVSIEGSAIISNRSGNLLMYTADAGQANQVICGKNHLSGAGISLLNRFHRTMKGSEIVVGSSELPNSLLLIPKPGFCNSIYYLLSVGKDPNSTSNQNNLYYYEIDMNRDNGLGEVVSSGLLANNIHGQLAATFSCSGSTIFVAAHTVGTPEYKLFSISEYTPPALHQSVQLGSNFNNTAEGEMKFSPDGSLLAMVALQGGTGYVDVIKFDNTNGTLLTGHSDRVLISSTNHVYYGMEFSPNSEWLYLAEEDELHRYHLNPFTTLDVRSSKALVNITGDKQFGQMELTPNKELIIVSPHDSDNRVLVITNPNDAVASLSKNNISLPEDATCNSGLPNNFISRHTISSPLLAGLENQYEKCKLQDEVIVSAVSGMDNYQWTNDQDVIIQNGTQNDVEILQAGMYYLTIDDDGCSYKFRFTVVESYDFCDCYKEAEFERPLYSQSIYPLDPEMKDGELIESIMEEGCSSNNQNPELQCRMYNLIKYPKNIISLLGTNPAGEHLWTRKFYYPSETTVEPLRLSSYQGDLLVLSRGGSKHFYLSRLDNMGNMIWSKKYTSPMASPSTSNIYEAKSMEVNGNEIVLLLNYGDPLPGLSPLLIKIDGNGNVVSNLSLSPNSGNPYLIMSNRAVDIRKESGTSEYYVLVESMDHSHGKFNNMALVHVNNFSNATNLSTYQTFFSDTKDFRAVKFGRDRQTVLGYSNRFSVNSDMFILRYKNLLGFDLEWAKKYNESSSGGMNSLFPLDARHNSTFVSGGNMNNYALAQFDDGVDQRIDFFEFDDFGIPVNPISQRGFQDFQNMSLYENTGQLLNVLENTALGSEYADPILTYQSSFSGLSAAAVPTLSRISTSLFPECNSTFNIINQDIKTPFEENGNNSYLWSSVLIPQMTMVEDVISISDDISSINFCCSKPLTEMECDLEVNFDQIGTFNMIDANVVGQHASQVISVQWDLYKPDGTIESGVSLPYTANEPGIYTLCARFQFTDCDDILMCKSFEVFCPETEAETIHFVGEINYMPEQSADFDYYFMPKDLNPPLYDYNSILGWTDPIDNVHYDGWIHHWLIPNESYIFYMYDQFDCLRKIITVNVVPMPEGPSKNNAGVQNLLLDNLQITPNPTQSVFAINLLTGDKLNFDNVTIYSTEGKRVKILQNITSGQPIGVDDLSDGVYIVEIRIGEFVRRERLVVANKL